MRVHGTLLVVGVCMFAGLLNGGVPQRSQERRQDRPFISYGTAKVSLGMTIEEVQQNLATSSRHMKTLPDDTDSSLVYVNGQSEPNSEGQIIFKRGRVIYADYKMPVVNNADELAQEIAGAVDTMETKTCDVSNYSAHGTGGGFTQSIFECGSRRFNVMAVQELGNSVRAINVNIEIGYAATK